MLKFGTSNIGKVFAGTSAVAGVYSGNNLIWTSAVPDTVFNVSKITSNVYANSTTYNDCKFIGFSILPEQGKTAEVTYGGITKTFTRDNSVLTTFNNVIFGQYGADADDGTPDTGDITFKNVESIAALRYSTAKSTTIYSQSCINSIVEWGALKIIGSNLFKGTSLTSISVNVPKIDYNAFDDAPNLQTVTLSQKFNGLTSSDPNPSSIISPNYGVCLNSPNLQFVVDANNPNYSSQNGILYNKNKTGIYFLPNSLTSGSSYTIASGITLIGDRVFANRSNLTTINGIHQLTSIGNRSFYSTGITSIDLNPQLQYIGASVFENSPLTSIIFRGYIGEGINSWGVPFAKGFGNRVVNIYCYADIPDYFFSQQHIFTLPPSSLPTPSGTTTKYNITIMYAEHIGDYAFYNANIVENGFDIAGSSLKTIGEYAFAGGGVFDSSGNASTSLTVEIPSSVTSMGDYCCETFKGINDFNVLALTPPTTNDDGAYILGTVANITLSYIYVPSSALSDYQYEWVALSAYLTGI